MKNVCLAALLAAALLVLPGCWNYKEVEEYDIVAGFAIDKGTGENKYKLTIDVVNISSKDVRPVTRILECEGKTLFDAIRIASRRDPSKLLWSHMQIAIVSEEVAREDIAPIVKLLITDAEPRLKLEILVSAEKTAGEILTSGGQPKSILSYDMNKELDSNDKLTGTTASNSELYQIYNKLGTKGTALTLPMVRNVKNNGEVVPEVGGIAVFEGSRMVGSMGADEATYFLFATNGVKKGLLNLKAASERYDVSLEVSETRAKSIPVYRDGVFSVKIKIATNAFLEEVDVQRDFVGEGGRAELERIAQKAMEENVLATVQDVQRRFGADIYGFGETIRKRYPKEWRALPGEWNEYFKTMNISVEAEIRMIHQSMSDNLIHIK